MNIDVAITATPDELREAIADLGRRERATLHELRELVIDLRETAQAEAAEAVAGAAVVDQPAERGSTP